MAEDVEGGVSAIAFWATCFGNDADANLRVDFSTDQGSSWFELGDFTFTWNINYIEGQHTDASVINGITVAPARSVGGYATNDVQVAWQAPWNGKVAIGAMNVGNRYPELVAFDGRPWNFYLYDAYGRTVYLRYTQSF